LNDSPALGDVFEGRPGCQATLNFPVMPKTSERVGNRGVRKGGIKTRRKINLT